MFADSVVDYDLSYWDWGNCSVNSSFMFQGNSNYRGVGLETWNTSGITTIDGMFFGPNDSFDADLTNWDIRNMTNLRAFTYCTKFTGKGLDGWNINNGKLTTLYYQFAGCSSFNQDLSGWDTSNITNMQHMFPGCYSFCGSGLENWNTSKVTNMQNMFFAPGYPQINTTPQYATTNPNAMSVS